MRECTFEVPRGHVIGLVGANGAGKTTLLHLIVGLVEPSEGTLAVLGDRPGRSAEQLARVGFVGQDAPAYSSLTVREHLRLGELLNPRWDQPFASSRVERLGLDPGQRAGRLSGGQRSQLALTLAMAKRPELLVLDEPVSSLDPLARRDFLADLMELVADQAPTIVLSSHSLADVERVCDHLVVMADGRVRLDGAVDDLVTEHLLLTGPRRVGYVPPADQHVVQVSHTPRQTTMLVRTRGSVLDPHWTAAPVGLEEIVLAYMSGPRRRDASGRLEAVRS
jgi:ABC-2 type transport system ATP-binding protein